MRFGDRIESLDRKVYDRLGDGEAIIDSIPIMVKVDTSNFLMGEARNRETILSISASLAASVGLRPSARSTVEWNGQSYRVSGPPMRERGLILLEIVT